MIRARSLVFGIFLAVSASLVGCNSNSISDIIDVGINEPDKQPINTSTLGINAFVNDSRFGSIGAQFSEVKNTLRLNYVRILFNFDDGVQGSPGGSPNFSFYDDIINGLPSGMEALVVLTGVPTWVGNSANWVEGNPRTTFVEKWVRPAVARYGSNPKIVGFEIWNEPNMPTSDNDLLGLTTSPENYVELLSRAYSVSKDLAPSKLVVNAATTAINQNFPDSIDYNRAMRDAGAASVTDKWNVHYYGKQYENVVRSGGVADFLNGLPKPIWITETGAQGVSAQADYGQRVWPFLEEKISGLERIYVYQFTEATPSDVTYGLKNLSGDLPISDLYVYLRDR